MIHPSAIVDPQAQLGSNVSIGPFCVIGAEVEIGDECEIRSHVVIDGATRLGRRNRVFAHCALGGPPQDKKYCGEPTRLEIGDGNTIREFCTLNRGTAQDAGVTRLGNDNWIMAYVHLAHDCQVGNQTIFANNAQLAGHVKVGDWAILGGFTVVHQFVHIGAHSFTAMGTILLQDLPPYVTAAGNTAKPFGINAEGLRRRGFSTVAISAIKRAYRTIYRSGLTLEEALAQLGAAGQPELTLLIEFLRASQRGIVR